ncbi:MAG TPA: hypothetical protein VLC09_10350, partial [Polyangiaceae bacterium]|nr:hypothetical protein [Polyangiaceae bacterium]
MLRASLTYRVLAWAPLALLGSSAPLACDAPFSNCEDTLTCEDSGGGSGSDVGGGGTGSNCPAECSGTTPVCDEDSGKCVPCLVSDDCKEGVCDVAKHE